MMAYNLACLLAEMKVGYMVDGWDHGLAAKKADWLAARSAF